MNRLKAKAECEGRQDVCEAEGCPRFGTLRSADRDGKRRVKDCGDKVAQGRQSKRLGQRGQAKGTTALGIPRSSLRPGHEENLPGSVRLEVKSGAQANPVMTHYLKVAGQSEASRPIGDHRPFVALFKPDPDRFGLVVIRDDQIAEAVAALAEQLGMLP